MRNTKTQKAYKIRILFITITLLTICTISLAESENVTDNNNIDPNIQKTLKVQHIAPNTAAEVINKIIKLQIFEFSKKSIVIAIPDQNSLAVKTETEREIKLIEKLIDNLDCQVKSEGMLNKKHIQVNNLVFAKIQMIVSPILSKQGYLSYNITSHILEVTDIAANLDYIENIITIIDSGDFDVPNELPEPVVTNTQGQADANSTEIEIADINEPLVAVRFSGFRIEHISRLLNQWTGKEVIPSEEARNLRISILTRERIRQSKAIALIFTALKQAGFVIEETGDTIFIKSVTSSSEQTEIVSTEEALESFQDRDKVVQKVFELKNIRPSIMGQLILSYLSPSGYFIGNETAGTLLISDKVSNLIKIQQMIEIYDSNSRRRGGIFEIPEGDPNEIVSPIRAIINSRQAQTNTRTTTTGRTRRNLQSQADTNSVVASPDDSNDPIVAVSLSGMKIDDIVQILKEWTGKEVIPSEEAQNLKITVYSPERMKRSEAIQLLYSTMRQQGFTAEMRNNIIYIKPASHVGGLPHYKLLGPDDFLEDIDDKDTVVRKIFVPKNFSASEIGQILLPLLSPKGNMTAESTTNTLMVQDTVKNLIQIQKMIETFEADPNSLPKVNIINPDDPNEEVQTQDHGTIYLRNIDSDSAVVKLNKMLKDIEFDVKKKLIILPLATSSQVLIFGNDKQDRELAENLVRDIDLHTSDDSYDFEKMPLRYFDPVKFSDLATKVIQEDANIRLSLYPSIVQKQILVFGQEEYRDVIRKFVEDIDIPPENLKPEIFVTGIIDSQKAAKILIEIFASTNTNYKNKAIIQDQNDQLLVIADDEIKQITKNILKEIDTQAFEKAAEYGIIPIKHVDFNDLTKSLFGILNETNIEFKNSIKIIPLTKLKSFLFFGDKIYCDAIRKMLDEPYEPGKLKRKSFKLEYAKPSDIKVKLDELFGDTNTQNISNTQTLSDDSVITSIYPSLNEIVVLASEEKLKDIKYLIEQWDREDVNNLNIKEITTFLENQKLSESERKADIDYDTISVTYIDVEEASLILNKIISKTIPDKAVVQPLAQSKQLIIFGAKQYRDLIINLVKQIDIPSNKLQRKTFRLMYANPEEVKNKLEELFGLSVSYDQNKNTISADPLNVVTFPSLKQIVVLASEEKMEEIEKQINEWDSPISLRN